jgi:ribonuclease HI
MSLKPMIYLAAFSTTGKSPVNGKVDTGVAVCVKAENETRTWLLPFKSATMNQAVLMGLRFGILAINPRNRDFLQVTTDSQYLGNVLAKKGDKYGFNPDSNVDLIKEARDLCATAKDMTYSVCKTDVLIAELREKIRVLGKKRLANV